MIYPKLSSSIIIPRNNIEYIVKLPLLDGFTQKEFRYDSNLMIFELIDLPVVFSNIFRTVFTLLYVPVKNYYLLFPRSQHGYTCKFKCDYTITSMKITEDVYKSLSP